MILDFASSPTLRPIQVSILEAVEANWNQADVFLISAPTGVGKSVISTTISMWCNREKNLGASIITPTNQLVEQYRASFCQDNPNRFVTLRAKSTYFCNTWGRPLSQIKRPCSPHLRCAGCNKRKLDMNQAKLSQSLLNNYHIVMMNRLHRPVLIADEAHNLLPVLQEMGCVRLWDENFHIPTDLDSIEKMSEWARGQKFGGQIWKKFTTELGRQEAKTPHYFMEFSMGSNEGRTQPCLKMTPISLELEAPRLWPKTVKKIILMSATIGLRDMRELGLSNRRIVVIEGKNPIEASRRKIVVDSTLMMNTSKWSQDENMPKLAETLLHLAEQHMSEKGLIHVTYSMAEKLRSMNLPPRFMFHNKENKQEVYQNFRSATGPMILVASGMHEGVDLPYDFARWQVVAKIPWPNRGNETVKYLAEKDPEWYAWQAARTLIQACGRTTRAEDDYSVTYILDSTIKYFTEYSHLFPQWFKDSLEQK